LKRIVIFSGLRHPTGDAALARRHDCYASAVNQKSDKQVELYSMATRCRGTQEYKVKFLKLIDRGYSESFLQLFFFSSLWARKLKRSEVPAVISSPDPFVLGFFVILLSKFMSGTPKIQIQCHGDFGDKNWQRFNLKNFIFSKLAGFVLRQADQVRCVGKNQAEKLISAYKIDSAKIVIAPIPTKDKGDLPEWIKPKIPVVSFLGRLHKERSVDLWVKTAQEIFSVRNDVQFLIIGDGPERENFQSGLNNIPANQVSFVGKLPNEEALELIAKSSLLLSTAPFESFGMAMVEAAKIGLPIVSKPTSGALDLSEGYDSISLGNSPRELAGLALAALNRETPGVISDSLFLQSENETVDAIVDAWIKLL
jgi:glycosyltransferase involved in cell wall biosynthesis